MSIKREKDKLSLLCTKSKYGNFVEGKVYEATSYASMGSKYVNFRIEDEDGDLYTIEEKHLLSKGPLLFKEIDDLEEEIER